MRIAVLSYPGVPRRCYQQLIDAALRLARSPRMTKMARWGWPQFSEWLHGLPFEMDTGCKGAECAKGCTPPQRMREFPPTMNCWERVLHQLAWFAARGADRVTVYDHDTLIGRHIEVLVPETTNLGTAANSAEDQALAGVFGGLQGGVQGGMVGSTAGPYGALAGLLLGAAAGVAKSVMAGDGKTPAAKAPAQPAKEQSRTPEIQPKKETTPAKATQSSKETQLTKEAPPASLETLLPTIQTMITATLQRPKKAKSTKRRKRGNP